jgi:hypothetical protein
MNRIVFAAVKFGSTYNTFTHSINNGYLPFRSLCLSPLCGWRKYNEI